MCDGWTETTLDDLVMAGVISLGRGDVISKKDMEADPGPYPVYSSAQSNNGQIGTYNKYMFDEALITWSVDGGGYVFYRPRHKFSVTNIGGYLRILDQTKFLYPFLAAVLQRLHSQHVFDWQNKAHPSVIRKLYNNIPLVPLSEQKRIVDVVTSVDAYIDALQQQADSARVARNAVLHELLSAGGDDWTDTTLGESVFLSRGGSPRPIQEFLTNSDNGINWVKIGDVSASAKYIFSTKEKIRPEGATKSRRVSPGDFVLSNSMSFGRPYIMRINGCIHDGWLLLSDVERHFDEDFLYNVLMSDQVQRQFNSLAAGSGVRNLNIDVVSEVSIPLPPRDVQKRIAGIANSIDEVIQSTEQAVEQAKLLRSGLLSDLLSGEHEIPESYDRFVGAA
jgi:restriction endonuclease S subunit